MSASPGSPGSPAAEEETATTDQPKKITFRFCDECGNMLYPKEDRLNMKLMFACRTCQHSEPAKTSCVYRNELGNTVGETAGITQDVAQDPTVGVPNFCTLCGNEILCPICGEPTENGLYLEADDQDIQAGSGGDGGGGGGTEGITETQNEEQRIGN